MAGLVGIVPEGLVLLTSVAFFAAALTLARRRVLIQELPAIEGLARVDVICLDKTGTLTEGAITLDRVERLSPPASRVDSALGALAAARDANATLLAVRRAFPAPAEWTATGMVAFSSERKWSAASFAGHGTWVLGAPEMVQPHAGPNDEVAARAGVLAGAGYRTLLLAHTEGSLSGDDLPAGLEPMAVVALHETLRPDAAETVAYFATQAVAVKVISGDTQRTVGAVGRRAGVPGVVFGRVVPEQKRAMVTALQARGHVVAMRATG